MAPERLVGTRDGAEGDVYGAPSPWSSCSRPPLRSDADRPGPPRPARRRDGAPGPVPARRPTADRRRAMTCSARRSTHGRTNGHPPGSSPTPRGGGRGARRRDAGGVRHEVPPVDRPDPRTAPRRSTSSWRSARIRCPSGSERRSRPSRSNGWSVAGASVRSRSRCRSELPRSCRQLRRRHDVRRGPVPRGVRTPPGPRRRPALDGYLPVDPSVPRSARSSSRRSSPSPPRPSLRNGPAPAPPADRTDGEPRDVRRAGRDLGARVLRRRVRGRHDHRGGHGLPRRSLHRGRDPRRRTHGGPGLGRGDRGAAAPVRARRRRAPVLPVALDPETRRIPGRIPHGFVSVDVERTRRQSMALDFPRRP